MKLAHNHPIPATARGQEVRQAVTMRHLPPWSPRPMAAPGPSALTASARLGSLATLAPCCPGERTATADPTACQQPHLDGPSKHQHCGKLHLTKVLPCIAVKLESTDESNACVVAMRSKRSGAFTSIPTCPIRLTDGRVRFPACALPCPTIQGRCYQYSACMSRPVVLGVYQQV